MCEMDTKVTMLEYENLADDDRRALSEQPESSWPGPPLELFGRPSTPSSFNNRRLSHRPLSLRQPPLAANRQVPSPRLISHCVLPHREAPLPWGMSRRAARTHRKAL